MKVTNNTRVTLGLPQAGPVEPGQSIDIPDSVAQNRIVSVWIGKGMLTVNGKAKASAAKPEDPAKGEADEGDEKDQIIAELAELGITRDKRTSLPNLRTTLEEAKADAEESEDDDA